MIKLAGRHQSLEVEACSNQACNTEASLAPCCVADANDKASFGFVQLYKPRMELGDGFGHSDQRSGAWGCGRSGDTYLCCNAETDCVTSRLHLIQRGKFNSTLI
jgi:hypothetical protein